MRERIEAMKTIWADDPAEYHGEFVDFDPIFSKPKPVQEPHPPIHVGGASPWGPRRAARYGDGWMPINGRGSTIMDDLHVLAEECEKNGRNIAEIELSLYMAPVNADVAKAARRASPASSSSCRRPMRNPAADAGQAGRGHRRRQRLTHWRCLADGPETTGPSGPSGSGGPIRRYPPPDGDWSAPPCPVPDRAQVVIVGSGIVGASIAYHLTREIIDVVVLEQNPTAGTTWHGGPGGRSSRHGHSPRWRPARPACSKSSRTKPARPPATVRPVRSRLPTMSSAGEIRRGATMADRVGVVRRSDRRGCRTVPAHAHRRSCRRPVHPATARPRGRHHDGARTGRQVRAQRSSRTCLPG